MVPASEVCDLHRQPTGESRPLPLQAELGITKMLRKNVLVRYELIGHCQILFNNKLVIKPGYSLAFLFSSLARRCLAIRCSSKQTRHFSAYARAPGRSPPSGSQPERMGRCPHPAARKSKLSVATTAG